MSQILRIQRVIQMTGLSRSSIYRLEREGEFPGRRRLGPNTIGWLEDDLVEWMRSLPRPRTSREAPASCAVGSDPA